MQFIGIIIECFRLVEVMPEQLVVASGAKCLVVVASVVSFHDRVVAELLLNGTKVMLFRAKVMLFSGRHGSGFRQICLVIVILSC